MKPVETEYMTVKEFAAAANITTQRIYKLYATGCTTDCNGIAAELHKYFKLVNGKKYIHRDALQLFENATELRNVAQQNATESTTAQVVLAALEQQLEILQQQLTVKDEQIRTKDQQISELHQQNKTLSDALENTTAALKDAQQSLTAAQALHAGTIQQQLTTEQQPQSELDVPTDPEGQEEQPAPKRSLFARIFKRK